MQAAVLSQVDNFDVQVKGIHKTSKRYFSCWEKSIDEEIERFSISIPTTRALSSVLII